MNDEIIYGIRPIIEAIRAGVEIHKIWLLQNKKNQLFKEVESYASKKKSNYSLLLIKSLINYLEKYIRVL